jgi:apolipoprotein N-acyltransferase
MKLTKTQTNLILLAAGAFFLFFTGGRYNFWLAAWFSSIFFMRYTRTHKAFKGYMVTALVSWVVIVFTWYGIQPGGGIFHGINMLVAALFSTIPLLLDKLLYRKVPGFAKTLVFPIFVTAFEYLLVAGNPMGSFGSIAYTQYGNLPLIQIISLTGMMSITFLISWLASVVNELWESNWDIRQHPVVLWSFIICLGFGYGYGGFRLIQSSFMPAEKDVSVSMIIRSEGDVGLPEIMSASEETRYELADQVFESFIERSLLVDDADILSWPEGAVVIQEDVFDDRDATLRELSDSKNIYLIAPFLILKEDGKAENSLILYTPEGEAAFKHVKFGGNIFEGSVPGDGSIKYTDSPFGRLSAVICWDMDFPQPLLQSGAQNVDILFSPSSEWREIVPMHAQMAVFRGIENGVSTVHPASKGLSVFADPYGRELSSLNWFRDSGATLDAEISSKGVQTLYASIGDIFPMINQLAALGIILCSIILSVVKKIRKKFTA